jgi:hypothetical protein
VATHPAIHVQKQLPSPPTPPKRTLLPIALGHTLQLILLLDRVRVRAPLRRVDQLLRQALGHGLDVPEGGLAGADGEERDGLVDAAQGRNVDGLTADGTGAADAGGVFAGAAVDDGVDGDLDRVLVGHDVDLHPSVGLPLGSPELGSGGTHDLEGVGDDADGHELLSVVTAVHHEGVGETLDDRALCLSESLLGVSAGGVGDVDGGSDLDVVAAGC